MIDIVRIGVDCTINDPVDVRCGGPEYLGFDFNVRKEDSKEMLNFIKEALNSLEVPCKRIYIYAEFKGNEDGICTKEKIMKDICEDANYLKHEAEREYRYNLYRR